MSTTLITEAMKLTTIQQSQIEFVKCECCGLTEECTQQYIQNIRERYMGKWVCGLCSEAVKDELLKSQKLISLEEALSRHINVCQDFRSSPPSAGGAALIAAVRGILRRSLDSPRGGMRSMPVSPTHEGGLSERMVALARSESCFPHLSL